MGVLDKFLDVMRLNPEDEDDMDYGYDEDDYEVEERPSRRKVQKAEAAVEKEENRFKAISNTRAVKVPSKITPMRSVRKQGGNMEVCVIRPINMEDNREITDTLLSGRTVVMNLEGLDTGIAQRIMDFTSGSCYAINGNLKKISTSIIVITPPEVDLSGDFLDSMEAADIPQIQSGY